MNILEKLKFTAEEQKLLKKRLNGSIAICIIIVVGFWIVPRIGKKGIENPQAMLSKSLGLGDDKNSGTLLPIDLEAHEWAADYAMRIDDPDKAIEHLRRIFPYRQNDRKIGIELASAFLQSRQYQNAYDLLSQLADNQNKDRLSDSINARLGLTLFYLGRTDEAKKILEECLANGNRSPEAACYLGQILATANSASPEGERLLLKAIGWEQNYAEAWYQLARYYMATGNYEKSRTHLLHVLDMQPLNVKAHSRLGMAYYYLGQSELAERSYQTALALNPNDFNTHYNLGELYAGGGDTRRALEEFKTTLRINPAHQEANFKVGLICLSNEMTNEAIGYFQKAVEHDRHNTRMLFQLAVAYEKAGMRNDALDIYKSVLGFDPLNDVAMQKVRMLTGSTGQTVGRSRPTQAESP